MSSRWPGATLDWTGLDCTVLCDTGLDWIVLYCALYCATLVWTVLYCIVLSIVPQWFELYCTVLSSVLCQTGLDCIVLYCIVRDNIEYYGSTVHCPQCSTYSILGKCGKEEGLRIIQWKDWQLCSSNRIVLPKKNCTVLYCTVLYCIVLLCSA